MERTRSGSHIIKLMFYSIYRIAQLAMTLSDLEGYLSYINLYNTNPKAPMRMPQMRKGTLS